MISSRHCYVASVLRFNSSSRLIAPSIWSQARRREDSWWHRLLLSFSIIHKAISLPRQYPSNFILVAPARKIAFELSKLNLKLFRLLQFRVIYRQTRFPLGSSINHSSTAAQVWLKSRKLPEVDWFFFFLLASDTRRRRLLWRPSREVGRFMDFLEHLVTTRILGCLWTQLWEKKLIEFATSMAW